MTQVKKSYEAIVSFLIKNKDKKVSTILEQVTKMCEAKQLTCTSEKRNGKLFIFCYYHKVWEDTTKIEYGSKKNTKTGLNSMCKDGVRRWTATQKAYKAIDAKLLTDVINGDLEADKISEEKAKQRAEIAEKIKNKKWAE